MREERAQTDVVVLGARQVLGEEPERARAEHRDVRQIAEADGRGGRRGEAPVVATPPGGQEHSRIELHEDGDAERHSREDRRSGLPQEEREEDERDHGGLHMSRLDPLEDDERRPRVDDHGGCRRAESPKQK